MYDTIIIIPYRDREHHLDIFLKNSLQHFLKYMPSFKLVIIEQDKEKQFNRGKLLNIVFSIYKNKTKFFITHDVDICPKEHVVKSIYLEKMYDVTRISVPHKRSFGQICKFSHDSIFSVNGFPNYIWGWGIEDRALYYRYNIMKKTISPNYSYESNFVFLHHKSNKENYSGEKKKISILEDQIYECGDINRQKNHIMASGINNVSYTIINKQEINDYVEWITVSI